MLLVVVLRLKGSQSLRTRLGWPMWRARERLLVGPIAPAAAAQARPAGQPARPARDKAPQLALQMRMQKRAQERERESKRISCCKQEHRSTDIALVASGRARAPGQPAALGQGEARAAPPSSAPASHRSSCQLAKFILAIFLHPRLQLAWRCRRQSISAARAASVS